MNLNASSYRFENLGKINVIVGRNGCGKSRCLRALDEHGIMEPAASIAKSYVTPERGGSVIYNPSIEQNIGTADGYLAGDRRKNQTTYFKPQSVSQFRKLFTKVLWKLNQAVGKSSEEDLVSLKFDRYLDDINSLLDQIAIEPNESMFEIKHKSSGVKIPPEQISSGESELISLSIECLAFEAVQEGKMDVPLLILDEPDVHLHPDLQVRFVQFLRKVAERSNLKIVLSTHSSPVLAALSDYEHAKIFFMKSGDTLISFENISDAIKAMLPVFGAHPLTSVFGESPVFLVEGTDEERIWQQAVRTSLGRIRVYPVVCGDIQAVGDFEGRANGLLVSVYDSARGYSLRDGDSHCTDIDDLSRVVRFRLHCYASENLLVTDEVLRSVGKSWE